MRHIIKLALACLAAVAAYFVYSFTAQVADWRIALFAAGSLVGSYVGLAFATIPDSQRARAVRVAQAAMIVEALYGFLYVLSIQSPVLFAAPLSPWLSVPLAALHGSAFSILAYFVSLFVVHERGGVPQVDQPPAYMVQIADHMRAAVIHMDQSMDRMAEHMQVAAAQMDQAGEQLAQLRLSVAQPAQIADQQMAQSDQAEPVILPDADQETIIVAQRRVTLRQLADATGTPVSTLRRRLAAEKTEQEES